MPEMLIEVDDVRIRLEWPPDNGRPVAVVPLEGGALLLIPEKTLERLDPAWLAQVRQKVSSGEAKHDPWPEWARPTPQKEQALRELRALGYNVSDGREYLRGGRSHAVVTLEAVHQALASIRGALSDTVIAEREQQ